MAVKVLNAVVVACDRDDCNKRSNPMDPDNVEAWKKRHEKFHDQKDRGDRMAGYGHKMEAINISDGGGSVDTTFKCSCSWETKSSDPDKADEHLRAAEAELNRIH